MQLSASTNGDEMKNLHIKCGNIKQRQNVIHILENNGFRVVRTSNTVDLPEYAHNAPECVLVEFGSFGMLDDENAEIRNPVKPQGVSANLIWNVLGGIAMGIVIFFILFGWVW